MSCEREPFMICVYFNGLIWICALFFLKTGTLFHFPGQTITNLAYSRLETLGCGDITRLCFHFVSFRENSQLCKRLKIAFILCSIFSFERAPGCYCRAFVPVWGCLLIQSERTTCVSVAATDKQTDRRNLTTKYQSRLFYLKSGNHVVTDIQYLLKNTLYTSDESQPANDNMWVQASNLTQSIHSTTKNKTLFNRADVPDYCIKLALP